MHEQSKNFHKETENLKKNPTEIWELKNATTKLKTTLGRFKQRLNQTGKKSANLKAGCLKLSSQRSKMKKIIKKTEETKRLLGYQPVNQYTHYGSFRRRREKEQKAYLRKKNA